MAIVPLSAVRSSSVRGRACFPFRNDNDDGDRFILYCTVRARAVYLCSVRSGCVRDHKNADRSREHVRSSGATIVVGLFGLQLG